MTSVNTKYFDDAIKKIKAIEKLEDKACDELQKYMDEVEEYIKKQLVELLACITRYTDLIADPTDLPGLIAWVRKVIGVITGPVNKMVLEYGEIAKKFTELMVEIQKVSNGLVCNLEMPLAPPALPDIPGLPETPTP